MVDVELYNITKILQLCLVAKCLIRDNIARFPIFFGSRKDRIVWENKNETIIMKRCREKDGCN